MAVCLEFISLALELDMRGPAPRRSLETSTTIRSWWEVQSVNEWIMAHPNMFFTICVFALWVIGDAVSEALIFPVQG